MRRRAAAAIPRDYCIPPSRGIAAAARRLIRGLPERGGLPFHIILPMTTPMMQQYRDAKERHPGMILLFRMGDFYELFESDAETAARVLGLTLTSRDKSIPMAGFPHHQLESYLQKLLGSGHRVAVCDQVEDPAQAKGLVRRDVTRVVTPGTLTEDDLLDPRQANHLAALRPGIG